MSTPTIPADDRANGSVRGRRGASREAPSLVAELVFRELIETDAPLTESELHERTLLPDAEVREALADLESRGLCTVRRGADGEPRRYVATFPSDPEA